MTNKKRITDEQKNKVIYYYVSGMSRKIIAKELDLGYSTVSETIREYLFDEKEPK